MKMSEYASWAVASPPSGVLPGNVKYLSQGSACAPPWAKLRRPSGAMEYSPRPYGTCRARREVRPAGTTERNPKSAHTYKGYPVFCPGGAEQLSPGWSEARAKPWVRRPKKNEPAKRVTQKYVALSNNTLCRPFRAMPSGNLLTQGSLRFAPGLRYVATSWLRAACVEARQPTLHPNCLSGYSCKFVPIRGSLLQATPCLLSHRSFSSFRSFPRHCL